MIKPVTMVTKAGKHNSKSREPEQANDKLFFICLFLKSL